MIFYKEKLIILPLATFWTVSFDDIAMYVHTLFVFEYRKYIFDLSTI